MPKLAEVYYRNLDGDLEISAFEFDDEYDLERQVLETIQDRLHGSDLMAANAPSLPDGDLFGVLRERNSDGSPLEVRLPPPPKARRSSLAQQSRAYQLQTRQQQLAKGLSVDEADKIARKKRAQFQASRQPRDAKGRFKKG
ncbi:MAG: hypothetical protein OXG44_11135 [Gammaproteobacteria bacterium]|nr:hypothetical protein [Gammaproteobacteria bacterium]